MWRERQRVQRTKRRTMSLTVWCVRLKRSTSSARNLGKTTHINILNHFKVLYLASGWAWYLHGPVRSGSQTAEASLESCKKWRARRGCYHHLKRFVGEARSVDTRGDSPRRPVHLHIAFRHLGCLSNPINISSSLSKDCKTLWGAAKAR